MGKLLASFTLVLLVLTPAWTLEYPRLLQAALEADPALRALEIDHRRALVDLELARLSRDPGWVFAAKGGVEVGGSDPEASWTASPEMALEWPRGPRWSLGVPVKAAPDQTEATPTLGLALPLVSGANRMAVEELERRVAADRALHALRDRRFEVERLLVEGLSALYQAWASLNDARRKHLEAQTDLDQAVALDGATPGGKAYSDGERALRMAWREVQRSQSAYRRTQDQLALLGIADLPEGPPGLVVPEVDLGAPLPPPEGVVSFVQADAETDLAEFRAREARKTDEASVRWGGGYALGGSGLDLSSGLQWSHQDWTTSLGVGWGPNSGSRLEVAVQWKPRGGPRIAWEDEASTLEAQGYTVARERARTEASRSLGALERRREELLGAEEHLVEDLSWARDQASRYGAWKRQGLVTATEVAEVEAVLVAVEAEAVLQSLEKVAWDLDRRRLTEEGEDHEKPN